MESMAELQTKGVSMCALPVNYKEPVTGQYMKFKDGENRFRVLSDIIVGSEFWKEETNEKGEIIRKPIRRRTNEKIYADELGIDKWGNPERPKFFWAMAVWNYDSESVQILEITQRKIQRAIEALERNTKWGDCKEYDLSVTRSGEDLATDYVVQPEPKEKLDPEIEKEYKEMTINLEALYDGGDPFSEINVKKEFSGNKQTVVTANDGDDEPLPEPQGEEEVDIESIPF